MSVTDKSRTQNNQKAILTLNFELVALIYPPILHVQKFYFELVIPSWVSLVQSSCFVVDLQYDKEMHTGTGMKIHHTVHHTGIHTVHHTQLHKLILKVTLF